MEQPGALSAAEGLLAMSKESMAEHGVSGAMLAPTVACFGVFGSWYRIRRSRGKFCWKSYEMSNIFLHISFDDKLETYLDNNPIEPHRKKWRFRYWRKDGKLTLHTFSQHFDWKKRKRGRNRRGVKSFGNCRYSKFENQSLPSWMWWDKTSNTEEKEPGRANHLTCMWGRSHENGNSPNRSWCKRFR